MGYYGYKPGEKSVVLTDTLAQLRVFEAYMKDLGWSINTPLEFHTHTIEEFMIGMVSREDGLNVEAQVLDDLVVKIDADLFLPFHSMVNNPVENGPVFTIYTPNYSLSMPGRVYDALKAYDWSDVRSALEEQLRKEYAYLQAMGKKKKIGLAPHQPYLI